MKFGEPKQVQEKIEDYRQFWNLEERSRPMIGFDVGGFFPFQWFSALSRLKENEWLKATDLVVHAYLDDYTKVHQRASRVDDDLIKGVSPIPAIPWMEAMLGCPVEISGDSIWGRERNADWSTLEDLKLEGDDPWFDKYLEFLAELVGNAQGEYPVSQPILRGITDLVGALRGNNQALIDSMESPALLKDLAARCAEALIQVTRKQYEVIEPFYGGYLIEQFGMWAPDRIVRLQEDLSAVYSPQTYCDLIQEYDRDVASAFPLCLIHLHNSSLFLLDHFLDIEEIDVFQINRDVVGMCTDEMIPYLKKVQDQNRRLLIRGSLTEADLNLIKRHLSCRGLILQIVLNDAESVPMHTEAINRIFT